MVDKYNRPSLTEQNTRSGSLVAFETFSLGPNWAPASFNLSVLLNVVVGHEFENQTKVVNQIFKCNSITTMLESQPFQRVVVGADNVFVLVVEVSRRRVIPRALDKQFPNQPAGNGKDLSRTFFKALSRVT